MNRDIHVIALNQTIHGRANPNITDWVIKALSGDTLGMVHKRIEDDLFELTSDFGNIIFETLQDASDFIQEKYNTVMFN